MRDHYLDVGVILSTAVVAASLLITATAAEVCILNCTSSNTIQNTFNLSCECLNGTAALNCSKPADIWTCELTAYPTSTCNEFVCRSHEQSSQNYSCSCFIRSGFDTTIVPNSSTPNHTITSHQKTCFGSGEEDFLECTIGVSISLAVIVVIVGIIIIVAKRMKSCNKRRSARQPPHKNDVLQPLERTGTIPNTYAPDQRQAHRVKPDGYSEVVIRNIDIEVYSDEDESDDKDDYLPMNGENSDMKAEEIYENDISARTIKAKKRQKTCSEAQARNTQEPQLPTHGTGSAKLMQVPQAQSPSVEEDYETPSPIMPVSSVKIPSATSAEDREVIYDNIDSKGKEHSNSTELTLASKIQAKSTNEKQHQKTVETAVKHKHQGSEEVASTQMKQAPSKQSVKAGKPPISSENPSELPEEHEQVYENVALPTVVQAKTTEEQKPIKQLSSKAPEKPVINQKPTLKDSEKLMTAATKQEREKASKASSASPQPSITPTTNDSAADGDVQNPFMRNLINQLKSVKQTNTSSNKRPQVPPPLPNRTDQEEYCEVSLAHSLVTSPTSPHYADLAADMPVQMKPILASKIQAKSTNEKQHSKTVQTAVKHKHQGSEEVASTQKKQAPSTQNAKAGKSPISPEKPSELPEEHEEVYENVALPTVVQPKTPKNRNLSNNYHQKR